MTTTATINYINCTEDSVSKSIRCACDGITSIELLGIHDHANHPGDANWQIALYQLDMDGYKSRAFSTNGESVWEDEDTTTFAESLAEYGIEANV